MKKVLFGFLSCMILICSCSTEASNVVENYQTTPTSEIVYKLGTFNDSLLPISAITARGSGCSETLTYASVAYKDIKGAYKLGKVGFRIGRIFGPNGAVAGAAIGGLIGGAGYSYIEWQKRQSRASFGTTSPLEVTQAYVSVVESEPIYSNFTPTTIAVTYPSVTQDTQLMGAKHNLVLQALVDNNLSRTPIEHCLTAVEDSIISSKEFEEAYYAYFEDENINSETNEDVPDAVMSLYLQIFQTYPERANDVEFITNKYIELIEESDEISPEEKEIIYSALSVAASSYEYWEEKLK